MTSAADPSTATPSGTAPSTDTDAVIAEVAGMLRARGERMTGPRRAVLTVLAERGEHLSADAVLDGVTRHDPGVHRASVYRTLDALSQLGVVQHVHVGHGGTAYHLVRDGGRHLHAHCRVCGAVHDLPPDLLDAVAATLARRHGFVLDAGHVALSGTCAGCAEAASGQEPSGPHSSGRQPSGRQPGGQEPSGPHSSGRHPAGRPRASVEV